MTCVIYKISTCVECKQTYTAHNGMQTFCSKKCAYKAKRKRISKWRKDNPELYAERCKKYNANRDLKQLLLGKTILKHTTILCVVCGKDFTPHTGLQKYCSKKCYKHIDNIKTIKKRNDNVELFRERDKKQYYKKHDFYKKRKVECKLKRMKNDPIIKIGEILRSRLRCALKNKKTLKTSSAIELVGCSLSELKKHLEKQFKEGMSWGNHSLYGWHIDHIKPVSSFNLIDIDEQKKCFHYTNLQPLWAEDNLSKGSKI